MIDRKEKSIECLREKKTNTNTNYQSKKIIRRRICLVLSRFNHRLNRNSIEMAYSHDWTVINRRKTSDNLFYRRPTRENVCIANFYKHCKK